MTATTASHGGMGRRASGSKQSGKSRMEGLTMSSTTTSKSSDNLHKLTSNSKPSSSTNLSGKRSKSHTNVIDANPTSSKVRRNPNSASRTKLSSLALSDRRKSATQLYKKKDQSEDQGQDQDQDQGGWTSTSENSTPNQSRGNSPDLESFTSVEKQEMRVSDESQDGRGRRQRKEDEKLTSGSKREGKRRELDQDQKQEQESAQEQRQRQELEQMQGQEQEEEEDEEEDEGLTMDTKRRGRTSTLKRQETSRESSPKFDPRDPPTPKAPVRQLDEVSQDPSIASSRNANADSKDTSTNLSIKDLTDSTHSVKSDGSDGTLAQEETNPQGETSSVLSATETLNSTSIAADSLSTSPRPSLDHRDSSASARTLRHSQTRAPGSPSSIRSKTSAATSTRTRAPTPSSRDHYSTPTGVAPPKLDTHNALVGALGALHEDRATDHHDLMSNRYTSSPKSDRRLSLPDGGRLTGSSSAPLGWQESGNEYFQDKRQASIVSPGSNINVSKAGPSMVGISQALTSPSATLSSNHHRRGEASEPGTSSSTWNDYSDTIRPRDRDLRLRTTSTQSLGAADAARLAAKLRLARDGGGEDRSFSHSNNSTSAAANALSRAGSAVGLSSLAMSSANSNSRSNMSSSRISEESIKPAVSTFSRNERKVLEPIIVNDESVYSSTFTHAEGSGSGNSSDGDDSGEPTIRGKNEGKIREGKKRDGKEKSKSNPQVRYLLDYGLSGPPLTPNALNNALLAPSLPTDEFDAGWAPALANAAGLGLRSSNHDNHQPQEPHGPQFDQTMDPNSEQLRTRGKNVDHQLRMNCETFSSGSFLANGPNASPLHFVYGLTSTSEDDFPLEEGELPRGLLLDGSSGGSNNPTIRNIDPKTMRAIALTSHALAVARSHTVTRRFRDPMRESLNRVVRESGHWPGQLTPLVDSVSRSSSSNYFNQQKERRSNPASPNVNSHGFNLSRTSSADSRKPNFHRANTGSGPDSHGPPILGAAAEQPLQSLKRVWSSGSRGGLAALTRASSQAGDAR